MLCEKCQKNPATVHVQQIINGSKAEMHLCAACSLMQETPISFENLIQGFLGSIMSMPANGQASRKETVPSVTCATCGMTYEMFKSGGKLGCADCYRTFAGELDTLLKNVQGGVRHEGKFPRRSGVELRQKREADRLRLLLNKAIESENYEEAASLRDRIRAMEVDA